MGIIEDGYLTEQNPQNVNREPGWAQLTPWAGTAPPITANGTRSICADVQLATEQFQCRSEIHRDTCRPSWYTAYLSAIVIEFCVLVLLYDSRWGLDYNQTCSAPTLPPDPVLKDAAGGLSGR